VVGAGKHYGGLGQSQGYLNDRSGVNLSNYNNKNKISLNRAAAIGGVSKSQNKSFRPLRDTGKLAGTGISVDNRMVNYAVTPSE